MPTSFIMLVDDEVPFVETMVKRLANRNIETVKAFSGEECLETLKRNQNIDAIVLDVKMPGMDGIETLKKIKKNYPLIEVIMLTGHATMETAVDGIKLGAYDYLMKPCEIDELMRKVKGAVRKKRAHEEKVQDWARLTETGSLKELMVPIAAYATVTEDANIFEAINALEQAQNAFNPERYRHRAILVLDREKRVVGKLNQHDIIQALEPQYKKSKERSERVLGHFGFGPSFIESVTTQYLVDNPLQNLYQKTFKQSVKAFMHVPTEEEYIEDTASMNEAIHRLIIGKHQSLLVTSDAETVGVLRLTDVLELLHLRLKAMELAEKIGGQADGQESPGTEG